MTKYKKWRSNRKREKNLRKLRASSLPTRLAIAKNSSAPEFLEELSEDSSVQVRQVVAENGAISEELILKLSNDLNSIVRAVVARRKDLKDEIIDHLLADKFENVLVALALRDKLTKSQQEMLLKSNVRVRQKLAVRGDLHPEISHKLSEDTDTKVKVLLASMTKNKTTIEKLHFDKSPEVQTVLQKRLKK